MIRKKIEMTFILKTFTLIKEYDQFSVDLRKENLIFLPENMADSGAWNNLQISTTQPNSEKIPFI